MLAKSLSLLCVLVHASGEQALLKNRLSRRLSTSAHSQELQPGRSVDNIDDDDGLGHVDTSELDALSHEIQSTEALTDDDQVVNPEAHQASADVASTLSLKAALDWFAGNKDTSSEIDDLSTKARVETGNHASPVQQLQVIDDGSPDVPPKDVMAALLSFQRREAARSFGKQANPLTQRHEELLDLKQTVLKLAAYSKTPGIQVFFSQMEDLLQTMQSQIRSQFDSTNSQLQQKFLAFQQCNLPNDFTSIRPNIPTDLATQHRQCREGQRLAVSQQTFKQPSSNLMNVLCGLYNTSASQQLGSSNCMVGSQIINGNTAIAYLQSQFDFWNQLVNKLTLQQQQCQNASISYSAALASYNQEQAALNNVKLGCDAIQAQLEQSTCPYQAQVARICNGYDQCYSAAFTAYSQLLSQLSFLQSQLQDEMSVALTLSCILTNLKSIDVTTTVQNCNVATLNQIQTIRSLTFQPSSIPQKQSCSGDPVYTLGTFQFMSTYYAGVQDLVATCNATCCPRSQSLR
jgi:hypothetical protein